MMYQLPCISSVLGYHRDNKAPQVFGVPRVLRGKEARPVISGELDQLASG